jgi:hypothetical protein
MADTQKLIRVEFMDSVAIMRDPEPKDKLDLKYEKLRADLLNKDRPPTMTAIKATIDDLKIRDRYAEARYGFKRDSGWKEGQYGNIPAVLAKAWEEAGMVRIVPENEPAKELTGVNR